MSKPFVILGQGGHAEVVLDLLQCLQHSIAGVVAPEREVGADWHGVPVLGDDEWLHSSFAREHAFALGMGMLPGRTDLRARLFRKLADLGLEMPPLIHPSAILAQNVQVGAGCQIMAGVIVQTGVKLGQNVLLNTGSRIDHHCQIAEHVHIAPGALLCGEVHVDSGVFVGAGATVIQGRVIGEAAQIAAGACVVRDVPARTRFIPGRPYISIEKEHA